MLIACWSPKGGSGTTTVAAALGLALARSSPRGAVVADLCGDVPAALGVAEPDGPGLADWLAAGNDVPADGIARLETAVTPALSLLAQGALPLDPDRAPALAEVFSSDSRPIIVDCGLATEPVARCLVAAAAVSLLVLRPCFLALRRAFVGELRATGVVLVCEPDRALTQRDVEELLGVPVRARVPWDMEVARAVDAGLLVARLPRSLEKSLRAAA